MAVGFKKIQRFFPENGQKIVDNLHKKGLIAVEKKQYFE